MQPSSPHSIAASPPFRGADGRWYVAVPVLGPDGSRRIGYLSARTQRGAVARLAAWRPLAGEPRLELGRLAAPGRRRARLVVTVAALAASLILGGEVGASRLIGSQASASVRPTAGPAAHRSAGRTTTTAKRVVDPLTTPGITQFLAAEHLNVTMALYDRVTGRTWVYRPGVTQTTASIIKVDILAALLHQSPTLDDEDSDEATTMIENSDDNAADFLWAADSDGAAVGAYNQEIGTTATTLNGQLHWGLSYTSALDQVRILQSVVYPGTALSPQAQAYEVNLMENVEADQRWGVDAGVPVGTTIAIKNGWDPLDDNTTWQVNSIGWMKGSGRDYVLAVLTLGSPTEQGGIDAIQGVAPQVWQALAPTGGG